jgi:signal transduction histidine kinase/DNA-binding response OmpR family regulator/PAS domain-containing protein
MYAFFVLLSMASWKKIIEYGTKPEMDELEKNRVILTNKTGLIVGPLIGIPFTISLLSFDAPLIIPIVLWIICLPAFLTPWVSKYLSPAIAKVLGIIEFCIGTLTISLMTSNGKQPEIDFFLTVSTAIMSAIMPMLFYAPHQKKQRLLGILFAGLCFVSYIPLSKIFYLPSAPSLKTYEYYMVGIFGFSIAMVVISISTGYIQRLDIAVLRGYIQKVKENEARLQEAQSIARLGTWEYCFETDTLIWSEQLYRNTGIPIGTPLTLKQFNEEMLPEEDRPKLNQAIHTAVSQTGVFDLEHRMYNAQREIMWIMAKGKVIFDAAGKPIKLLGTARDFTQEKLSDLVIEQQNRELQAREEELRQNLEELQTTQEQLQNTYHNLQERVRIDEIITQTSNVFVNIDNESLIPALEQTLQKIGVFMQADFANVMVLKNDYTIIHHIADWSAIEGIKKFHSEEEREMQASFFPYFTQKIIQEAQNVVFSDLMEISDEAKNEKMFFSQLGVKAMIAIPMLSKGKSIGMVSVTKREYRTWKENEINLLKTIGEIFGNVIIRMNSEKELIAKTNALQSSEEELRQNLEELQATQEQMRLYQHDLEEKNREMEELNEKLEDLVEARTQELVVAKEAAEIAQKQAEQANKVKSDFLSNMSHELRTPLNGILGYAQILMNDGSVSEKHKEKLQIINKSGEHLLGLINDILDLSKIEAGKMELHYAETDLHALVQEIYDLFKLRCENKGLQLIVEKDTQLPKYVRTDTGKLRQCIINFMGNAVKFTPKGSITFIVNKEFNGNIRFAVQDTGRGIPKDKISEMTKPFTQIYNTQNTEGGTGLGLAITKSYIELMGGVMHIESEVDKGSTFSFSLPLEVVEAPVQISQKSTQKVIGIKNEVCPKILIVDDSQINVDVANEFLQSVGFVTKKAFNGKEAVEMYAVFKPDLILMDIRMPVMNGFEATKEIRTQYPESMVKVIAVTADAFEHQRHEIIQSGLDDYVAKPYTASQLFDCIAKNLDIEYLYENDTTISTTEETAFNIDELEFTTLQQYIPNTWVTEAEQCLLMGNMEQLSTVIQSLPEPNIVFTQLKKYLLQQIEDFNDLAVESFLKKINQTV